MELLLPERKKLWNGLAVWKYASSYSCHQRLTNHTSINTRLLLATHPDSHGSFCFTTTSSINVIRPIKMFYSRCSYWKVLLKKCLVESISSIFHRFEVMGHLFESSLQPFLRALVLVKSRNSRLQSIFSWYLLKSQISSLNKVWSLI